MARGNYFVTGGELDARPPADQSNLHHHAPTEPAVTPTSARSQPALPPPHPRRGSSGTSAAPEPACQHTPAEPACDQLTGAAPAPAPGAAADQTASRATDTQLHAQPTPVSDNTSEARYIENNAAINFPTIGPSDYQTDEEFRNMFTYLMFGD